ncbi:MAG: hypothetical protein CL862_14475 [Cyanobium sp. NAT70]|nr:hypothetical protein [Cyanobium sp. NAT70]
MSEFCQADQSDHWQMYRSVQSFLADSNNSCHSQHAQATLMLKTLARQHKTNQLKPNSNALHGVIKK